MHRGNRQEACQTASFLIYYKKDYRVGAHVYKGYKKHGINKKDNTDVYYAMPNNGNYSMRKQTRYRIRK